MLVMNDAEEQFADRLAEDIGRVLGVGIAIDDIELAVGEAEAHVVATLLVDGRGMSSRRCSSMGGSRRSGRTVRT